MVLQTQILLNRAFQLGFVRKKRANSDLKVEIVRNSIEQYSLVWLRQMFGCIRGKAKLILYVQVWRSCTTSLIIRSYQNVHFFSYLTKPSILFQNWSDVGPLVLTYEYPYPRYQLNISVQPERQIFSSGPHPRERCKGNMAAKYNCFRVKCSPLYRDPEALFSKQPFPLKKKKILQDSKR